MLGYIYKITNLKNKKVYIGQHKKLNNSLTELDKSYWASGIKINNALNKYGYENFIREILCWCDSQEELNTKEIFYIKEYNSTDDNIGYNIVEGGCAGNLVEGYSEEELKAHYNKISKGNIKAWEDSTIRNKYIKSFSKRGEDWKNKISKSLTGRKGTPMKEETKQKLREINLGNKYGLGNKSRTGQTFSKETLKKMSERAKQVKHTEEWNEKVSLSLKGKPKSEEHKKALRKPKPKYYFMKPNGDIIIMDASNGKRHKDWIQLDKVENSNSNQITKD